MTGMIYFSKLCSLILLILFSFAGYCPNWVHTALDSINNINSTSNSDSGEIAIAEKKIEARRITPWHFYAHLSFACTLLFIANWPFSWLEIDSPDTRFICSRKWKAENVRLTEWASGWREPGKTPAANGSQRNAPKPKPRPKTPNRNCQCYPHKACAFLPTFFFLLVILLACSLHSLLPFPRHRLLIGCAKDGRGNVRCDSYRHTLFCCFCLWFICIGRNRMPRQIDSTMVFSAASRPNNLWNGSSSLANSSLRKA